MPWICGLPCMETPEFEESSKADFTSVLRPSSRAIAMSPNMAPAVCLRCLCRSIDGTVASNLLNGPRKAAFSTSSTLLAAQKKAVPAAARRKTLTLSKNVRSSGGGKLESGERKASRKRLVLHNPNAVPVTGLVDLQTKDSAAIDNLKSAGGQVLGIDEQTVKALQTLGAFKHTQGWKLFHRPATLMRSDTLKLAQELKAVDTSAESTMVRKIIYGEKGSGKSVLLLQLMAMALQRGWFVVAIPNAEDWTIGHTAYEPLSTPEGLLYIQPHATLEFLQKLITANEKLLSKLRVGLTHKLPVPVKADSTLLELAQIGTRDAALAWPVWQALLKEMQAPSKEGKGLERPKMLFAVDGVNHFMRDSHYLNAEAKPIHAHHLALVNDFIGLLKGGKANGGMVVGAVSRSNNPNTPTFDMCLKQRANAQTPREVNKSTGRKDNIKFDPYVVHDELVRQSIGKDVDVHKVSGLTKDEARSLMEYYARSGLMRAEVSNELVNSKWVVAGGGIVGELERATVMSRF